MTFNVSESILLLKKAKKMGKIGDIHDFQSKWINFIAKKAKYLGKNRWYVVMTFKVSESITLIKKEKKEGKK